MRFDGLDGRPEVTDALMPAPEHWPTLTIEHRVQEPMPVTPMVTTSQAVILLVDGGHAVLDRERLTITLHGPQSLWTDWFVHPTLAAISSVFSNWLGRHAIHAGAFVAGGAAWALIGVKQAGKSSTLGWLAGVDRPILADDLVVSDDGMALAGPRTLDLVPASARYLCLGGHTVRDGERQRLRVPAVDPEVPLRGWFALAWGDTLEARPIPPGERLEVLIENLRIPLDGPGSSGLLDLAALPGFALCRPRSLDHLPQAGARILEIATAS
jgi:hypothetical protein